MFDPEPEPLGDPDEFPAGEDEEDEPDPDDYEDEPDPDLDEPD